MPFAGQDFSPIGIGSVTILSFDYQQLLETNETITSASWQATLESGVDPAPQDIIDGAAQIDGTVVLQMIDLTDTSDVVNANVYLLVCSAVTSLGQTLLVWSHLPAIAPA